MKKTATNQNGSAIVLVLIFMVVATTAVLQVQRFLAQTSKEQAKRSQKYQFYNFIRSLKNQIRQPQICSNIILNGQSLNPLSDSPVILKGLPSFDGDSQVIGGSLIAPNLKVDQIFLRPVTGAQAYPHDIQVDQAGVPRRTTYLTRLFVVASNSNTHKSYSNLAKEVELSKDQEIELFVNIDSSGNIGSCYGADTGAHFCERLGAAWNPAESNPELRCNPNIRCFTKNVISSGSCGAPYVQKTIGFTSSSQMFLCEWCNSYR